MSLRKFGKLEIERSRRERTGSVAAYDLYLQALPKLRTSTPDGNAAAYGLLSAAIAIEPNNGVLLAQAVEALHHRTVAGWPMLTPDDYATCRDLAHRALANARNDATVLAFCGMAMVSTSRAYDFGLATIRRAVATNPNNLEVVTRAGVASIHVGSLDDALAYFNRTTRLSPADPDAFVVLTGIAHVQMILGKYVEALDFAERSLAVNSNYDPTYWMLISGNAQLGGIDEARRWLSKFHALVPGVTIASIRDGQPDRDPTRLAAILEGLGLAGLDAG